MNSQTHTSRASREFLEGTFAESVKLANRLSELNEPVALQRVDEACEELFMPEFSITSHASTTMRLPPKVLKKYALRSLTISPE